MDADFLDACLTVLRGSDAPMSAAQIVSLARGGKRPSATAARELEQELTRVSKESGLAEWPVHGRSRLFWTKTFRQSVEESFVKTLEAGPMTPAKAAKPVSKLLRRASEGRTLAELKAVAPQLAASSRVLQVATTRQSVVYLSFDYLARFIPARDGGPSVEDTILRAVEQLQSGPGNYVRVDYLRNTAELRGQVDRAVISLADKGQLVLGRYDGPRPIPDEEKSNYIEDDGGELFIGVALPRDTVAVG